MKENRFLTFAMIVTMGLAGWSFARSQSEVAKITADHTVVCQEHKLLAMVAKEGLESSLKTNPKITSFPGFTPIELRKLIREQEHRDEDNLGKLQEISSLTC